MAQKDIIFWLFLSYGNITVSSWFQLQKPILFKPKTLISNEIMKTADSTQLYTIMSELEKEFRNAKSPLSIKDLAGCWEVLCTKPGPKGEPSWTKYSKVLTSLNINAKENKNCNYQIFCNDGTFTNLSEYISNSFFATASGSYKINKEVPQVTASVDNVKIYVWGSTDGISLGVKGTGYITLRYLDSKFRIFENEDGAQVLQRKLDKIPDAYIKFYR
eukprot:gene1946-3773_t